MYSILDKCAHYHLHFSPAIPTTAATGATRMTLIRARAALEFSSLLRRDHSLPQKYAACYVLCLRLKIEPRMTSQSSPPLCGLYNSSESDENQRVVGPADLDDRSATDQLYIIDSADLSCMTDAEMWCIPLMHLSHPLPRGCAAAARGLTRLGRKAVREEKKQLGNNKEWRSGGRASHICGAFPLLPLQSFNK